MSAIGSVIEYYEDGKKWEEKGQYLLAARCYRLCSLYYDHGELPWFDQQVQDYGEAAYGKYFDCREKLSEEEKHMLGREHYAYKNGEVGGWREYADLESERILQLYNSLFPARENTCLDTFQEQH